MTQQFIYTCQDSATSNFHDKESHEYSLYGTCDTCCTPIMLLCIPRCQGSHDYTDNPPCTLVLANHDRSVYRAIA